MRARLLEAAGELADAIKSGEVEALAHAEDVLLWLIVEGRTALGLNEQHSAIRICEPPVSLRLISFSTPASSKELARLTPTRRATVRDALATLRGVRQLDKRTQDADRRSALYRALCSSAKIHAGNEDAAVATTSRTRTARSGSSSASARWSFSVRRPTTG